MSVILALLGVLFDVSWVVRLLGAPLRTFAFFSLANDTSTWAGYEMLKYVSFAVQVMAKSASVLPTMITAYLVNKQVYNFGEYVQAILLVTAVAVMQLEDEKVGQRKSSATSQTNDASSWLGPFGSYELQMGGLLLVVFFTFDSLTSQYQTRIYKRYKNISHWQMMLGGNFFAAITTLTVAVANRVHAVFVGSPVSEKSVGDVSQATLVKLGLLALTNSLGQVLIYYTIKQYGALIFQWIMTTRKVLSVVCSLIWFGHPVTFKKVVCIFFVFGLLIYQKVASKTSKGKDLKENGGDAKKAEHGKWRVSSWSVDITSETSQSDTESKPQRSSLRSWWVGGKLKES